MLILGIYTRYNHKRKVVVVTPGAYPRPRGGDRPVGEGHRGGESGRPAGAGHRRRAVQLRRAVAAPPAGRATPAGWSTSSSSTIARVAELLGAPALAAPGPPPAHQRHPHRGDPRRAGRGAGRLRHRSPTTRPRSLALDRTFAELRAARRPRSTRSPARAQRAAEVVRLFRADPGAPGRPLLRRARPGRAAAARGRPAPTGPGHRVPAARSARLDAAAGRAARRPRHHPPRSGRRRHVDRVISARRPRRRGAGRGARRGRARRSGHAAAPHRDPVAGRRALRRPRPPAPRRRRHPAQRPGRHHARPHRSPARALARLLALPDRRFRRDDVMAWLASAPILEVAGERGRRAGQPVGRRVGRRRRHRGRRPVARPPHRLRQRRRPSARPRWPRKTTSSRGGSSASTPASTGPGGCGVSSPSCSPPSSRARIAHGPTFSEWAAGLLDRYLGRRRAPLRLARRASRRPVAPSARRSTSWRRSTSVARQRPRVDLARFRQAVDAELATPAAAPRAIRSRRVHRAISAPRRGTDFDVVHRRSAWSRARLPSRPVRGRAAAGPRARARRAARSRCGGERIDAEFGRLPAALAAGAPADAALSRAPIPAAGASACRRVGCRDETHAAAKHVDSFQHGVVAGAPASLLDYDLRDLLDWIERGGEPVDHALAAEVPSFGAGLVAADFRASTAFTSFDGNVGAGHGRPVRRGRAPTRRPASRPTPTARRATSINGCCGSARPSTPRRSGASARSTRARCSTACWSSSSPARSKIRPARNEARLLELAEAAFDDYDARGLTGVPLLWRYERELMRREFASFFATDDDGAEPLAAELGFGVGGEEPVVLTLPDGAQVGFRGSADRVDRMPDGTIRVTDYKTGARRRLRGHHRRRSHRSRRQAAAAALRPGGAGRASATTTRRSSARYWFVSEKPEAARGHGARRRGDAGALPRRARRPRRRHHRRPVPGPARRRGHVARRLGQLRALRLRPRLHRPTATGRGSGVRTSARARARTSSWPKARRQ